MDPPDAFTGLWDTGAGYLEPETAVLATVRGALADGLQLHLRARPRPQPLGPPIDLQQPAGAL